MFVVIDGLDGSGKSTQVGLLADDLQRRGSTIIVRSHPSDDSFFGVRARAYLFLGGRKAHIAASLFYLADVVRSITLYSWRSVDYVVFVRYLMGTDGVSFPLVVLTAFLSLLAMAASWPINWPASHRPSACWPRTPIPFRPISTSA